MTLAATTYRRLAADLRALEQQTRSAFLEAVIELVGRQGLSGIEAARQLGVSQPHVARTVATLRLAGLIPAATQPGERARIAAADAVARPGLPGRKSPAVAAAAPG
jgi:hypothetical protein